MNIEIIFIVSLYYVFFLFFSTLLPSLGWLVKCSWRLVWNDIITVNFLEEVIKWVKILFKLAYTLSICGDLLFLYILIDSGLCLLSWPFSWKKIHLMFLVYSFCSSGFSQTIFRFLYHFLKDSFIVWKNLVWHFFFFWCFKNSSPLFPGLKDVWYVCYNFLVLLYTISLSFWIPPNILNLWLSTIWI